ncbi:MAG TPA: LysE family transporter [Ensifer sp.]|uniref:LysE family translocator n=1 Tax=Ensifer sp. TaxID=1872086 RepID=UPI002E1554E2|nr:LysE family transporter [Ensifer sp.]
MSSEIIVIRRLATALLRRHPRWRARKTMTELLAVVTITIIAVISPGPDFAMVTRNSLLLSRRAGVLTALGIGAGVCVHVTYTLLGVGLVIRQSVLLFDILKLVGAVYLIWLGTKMLRAKPAGQLAATEVTAISDLGALRMGFFTNALNPKTTVFVVSLFMQVVEPTTALSIQIGYGAFIAAAHVIWFTVVAVFFSSGAVRLRLLDLRHWIDRAFGALLVGFGVLLATANLTR